MDINHLLDNINKDNEIMALKAKIHNLEDTVLKLETQINCDLILLQSCRKVITDALDYVQRNSKPKE